jgi:hypothetical protein
MATVTGYTADGKGGTIRQTGMALDKEFNAKWIVCSTTACDGVPRKVGEPAKGEIQKWEIALDDKKKEKEDKACSETKGQTGCSCKVFVKYVKTPPGKENDKKFADDELNHWVNVPGATAPLITEAFHTMLCASPKQ